MSGREDQWTLSTSVLRKNFCLEVLLKIGLWIGRVEWGFNFRNRWEAVVDETENILLKEFVGYETTILKGRIFIFGIEGKREGICNFTVLWEQYSGNRKPRSLVYS